MTTEGRRIARLAVAGVGQVGRRHAEIAASEATLAGIADPGPAGAEVAAALGVPRYPDLPALIAAERPDGVIVATPNRSHEPDGMACIAAGIPVLIEKPLAENAAAGARLVDAAARAGVPLLVGHHRRYNPVVAAAKRALEAGRIGRVVACSATTWLRKPEDYFDTPWRREPGAGPILVNLVHDIELMLHLCGEVVAVQAQASSAVRGFAVEDTAVALLRFADGALGTISVSDTIAAPWSWELTAGENPAYPVTDAFAYTIGGTRGALSIPDLNLWSQPEPHWHRPIVRETLPAASADPLAEQVRHFAEVALGRAAPRVTGADGLRALKVVEAIARAAETGQTVAV